MPWTYWMAFPVLSAAGLVLLAFGVGYLKKVVEPRLQQLDRSLARQHRTLGRPTLSPARPTGSSALAKAERTLSWINGHAQHEVSGGASR